MTTLAQLRPAADWPWSPTNLPTAWLGRSSHYTADQSLRDHSDGENIDRFVRRGWALRARLLRDGRRQVLELLLPGDHLPAQAGNTQDHLSALTACEIVNVPSTQVLEARRRSPELDGLIAVMEERRRAISDERLVSLGRRDAVERMAQLFCELLHRLQDGDPERACELPMIQADLADFTGLSVVHTNRTLQTLRSMGLVRVGRPQLKILDYDRLAELADFSPGYLFGHRG